MSAEMPENFEKQQKFIVKATCSWCKKDMGERESAVDIPTHGICEECRAKYFPKTPKREV
mgnify:CR=1 FL=1